MLNVNTDWLVVPTRCVVKSYVSAGCTTLAFNLSGVVPGVPDSQSTPASTCLEGGASEGGASEGGAHTWLRALPTMTERFLISRVGFLAQVG